MKNLIQFETNRVRRNYRGGLGIDTLRGLANPQDSDKPEEWLASVVAAKNPGLPPIKNEGLSIVRGEKKSFSDLLREQPEFYLGASHYSDNGFSLGFLAKILDSSMRLHVQAHPTRDFAKARLNSEYGKLELYYILSVREGIEPYIRLGFQNPPTRGEWKRIIETQDIAEMDACFEKIPVAPGEVWLVPGGLPHAIGEGVTMLEIMEPSDWVVRCEFEREGIVVPPEARFMGRGLDFCLDIFDYTKYDADTIRAQNRLKPETLVERDRFTIEGLAVIPGCFTAQKLSIRGAAAVEKPEKFLVGVVCSGEITVSCADEKARVRQGESFFAGADCGEILFQNNNAAKSEICLIGTK